MNICRLVFCIFLYLFASADTIQKDKAKTNSMTRLSSTNGLVDIDESKFKSFVHTKKRDYHVILLFTVSLKDRNCAYCKEATLAFEEAARNWRFSEDFDSSLFFAKADFDLGGMEVFKAFEVNTAPVVYFLHADGSQKHSVFMEKYGFTAEGYAAYIEKVTDIKIKITKLTDYTPLIYITTFALIFFAAIRYNLVSVRFLFDVFGQTSHVIIIFFILTMTSGFMWNHMRNSMLVYGTREETLFIHPQSDGQLIAESFIILGLNLSISVGMVIMAKGEKTVGIKRKAVAMLGLLVTTGFFYGLMMVFRNKYDGYPKALLFF